MLGANICLMDARNLKTAMADIVAELLLRHRNFLVRELRFQSQGAMLFVSVEGLKYIAWALERDDIRSYTLALSNACVGYSS